MNSAMNGFRLLWFGEGVSVLGNAMTSVLLPVLAVAQLGAGPAWMGVIAAAAWLPWLVIGLPAGAWVDNWPPRTVMIVADVASASAMLAVPVSWWLGILSLTQLATAAFLGGVATVFFRTAYVKLVPLVVADDQLETANSRLLGAEAAMTIAGPAAAGVLLALTSSATGLLVDVFSFLVSALCVTRVRTRTAPAPPTAQERLSRRIGEGARLVAHDRNLRTLTITGGLSNFGLTGFQALLVVYLIRRLDLGPAAIGIVFAIDGVGGLIGAALAPRLARTIGTGRASTTLLLISGGSALLVGLPTTAGTVWLTALGLALVGATVVGGNVIRGSWRQRYVPPALIARVITSSQMFNYGTMPLAGLAAGALGAQLGARSTVILMASVHALACTAILFTRLGRSTNLPAALTIAPVNASIDGCPSTRPRSPASSPATTGSTHRSTTPIPTANG